MPDEEKNPEPLVPEMSPEEAREAMLKYENLMKALLGPEEDFQKFIQKVRNGEVIEKPGSQLEDFVKSLEILRFHYLYRDGGR